MAIAKFLLATTVCLEPCCRAGWVSTSTSKTMNSRKCLRVQTASNGSFQYPAEGTSSPRSVYGSTKYTAEPMRCTSRNGETPPCCLATLFGKRTRSSRHKEHSSIEIVCLCKWTLDFLSCETSCLDSLLLQTAWDATKSRKAWAWENLVKWKSKPSSFSVMNVTRSWASCFSICCSKKRNVLLCSARCLNCTCAAHVYLVYDRLHSSH
mmetsp:Transcript_5969/g.14212  ORF Transcript_5969/g.14212 Transcript_5969/m.14212 type:complete len:208 (-) Transcript_5969:449-1072(-)